MSTKQVDAVIQSLISGIGLHERYHHKYIKSVLRNEIDSQEQWVVNNETDMSSRYLMILYLNSSSTAP